MLIKNLLLVGGDQRALRLETLLISRGYQVATWGLRTGDGDPDAVRAADALLFPYPYAVKGGKGPALTERRPAPEAALEMAAKNALVLAGHGLEGYVMRENSHGKGLRLSLYERHEPFLQTNAEISAEAAVYEAMGLGEETVAGRTALVTGYGRFGQALAKRLLGLGATVWVAARREKQRLSASADGMRALPLDCLPEIAPELSVVLNTIPAQVLADKTLERLPKRCVLLELAGAPGGFDPAEAERAGLRWVRLPGLPARYAPLSAARAMMGACEKLLTEAET